MLIADLKYHYPYSDCPYPCKDCSHPSAVYPHPSVDFQNSKAIIGDNGQFMPSLLNDTLQVIQVIVVIGQDLGFFIKPSDLLFFGLSKTNIHIILERMKSGHRLLLNKVEILDICHDC